MVSSSAPATPKEKTEEEFNGIVRSLNLKYRLGLMSQATTLSPSRLKLTAQADKTAGKRQKIRNQLKALYFNKRYPSTLHQVLRKFDEEATKLCHRLPGTASHSPPTPHSVPRLLEALYNLLSEALRSSFHGPSSPNIGFSQSFESKMTTSLPTTPLKLQTTKRLLHESPDDSKAKRARNVHMSPRPTNLIPSSLGIVTSTDDEDYETAPESPLAPFTPVNPRTPQFPSTSTFQTRQTPNLDFNASSGPSSPSPPFRRGYDVRDSLRSIWPKLPSCLTHAPLGVCWEVTRLAVSCGVPLESLETLTYDETWHDQKTLHEVLLEHPSFNKKKLSKCSAAAWEASLSTFQSRDNSQAVSLSITLDWNPNRDGSLFKAKLQPLRLETSHRLSRRFGADRILEINLPSPAASDKPWFVKKNPNAAQIIIDWLSREKHYAFGRVWAAFWVKKLKKREREELDGGETPKKPTHGNNQPTCFIDIERVYLFAEDGNSFTKRHSAEGEYAPLNIPDKSEATTPSERTKVDLADMLDWTLSIREPLSRQQPSLKLFSRIALSLSRTQVAAVVEPHQIRHQAHDLVSPTGNVMNDGIARMSTALVRRIAENLGLDELPSVYQGRFGSAKGLWIRDVTDLSDDLWIETYPSQRKWDCDYQDECHRSFEVRAYSRPLKPANVNLQFIEVLCDRARDVPQMREAIESFLVTWLEEELGQQRAAMSDPVLLRQWLHDNFFQGYRAGRLRGNVEFLGGMPDGEAEMLIHFLDMGFHPEKLWFLREQLKALADRKMETLKSTLKIRIPRSTYAFMAIDFQGILQPGEVHLAFSSKFKVDDNPETLLSGDLLVARAPAHFPSDIQRVKAVFRPELAMIKDTIVFPRTGNEALADLLSGGDYDGDLAWVCWEPSIVNNFQNASAPDCEDLQKLGYLRKEKGTFADIVHRMSHDMDKAVTQLIAEGFTFNMRDQLLGMCTSSKETYCYHTGRIDDECTLLLSSLLSALVDQSKQGIIFTMDDWKRFKGEQLADLDRMEKPAYKGGRGQAPDHVLDYLKFSVAEPLVDAHRERFHAFIDSAETFTFDADLARHAKKLDMWELKDVRMKLEAELETLRSEWGPDGRAFNAKALHLYERWQNIKPLSNPRHPDILKTVLGPDETLQRQEWALIKASKTFQRHHKTPRFVWQLAGRELQWIKAMSVPGDDNGRGFPGAVPVAMPLYAALRPDKGLTSVRATAMREDGDDFSFGITDFDEDTGVQIDDA